MVRTNGITRNVILIGKYAFKFPTLHSHIHFLNGCYANYSERRFYKNFKGVYVSDEDLTSKVAPSLFCSYFGLLQIQRRLTPLTRDLTPTEVELFKGVCTDIKKENFGYLNGKLLCLDYP